MEITVWSVLLAATLTALATGLGALPFLAIREVSGAWLGLSSAAAGGLMLAASHGLVSEGTTLGPARTVAGVLLGLALIMVANRLVTRHRRVSIAELRGADARKALLILGVMTAHSFAEGVGVGVSFGGGERLGVYITAAIALHNVPEGLAISLTLVPRGTRVWTAAAWSVATSLPQPVMAVPAFLFVLAFEPFLPVGLGLAAGAMIWMVFSELVPDALERSSSAAVGAAVTAGFAAMLAFQVLLLGP